MLKFGTFGQQWSRPRVGAAPGVLLTPATLTVPEGGSREYTVELASQPTADVTVAMSQSGSTDVRHSADNSLTFTAATWASSQTVTVWAAHDADYDDDTATISHSVTSTDTGYQGISGGDVEVTVADDEKSPLTVSFGASTYNVAEGRSEVVTVRLSPEPDRMVTIPFDRRHEGGATSADYTGVPDSVVFNSGVTEQTFTVTAVNDTVNDDDEYIDLAFGMLPTGDYNDNLTVAGLGPAWTLALFRQREPAGRSVARRREAAGAPAWSD